MTDIDKITPTPEGEEEKSKTEQQKEERSEDLASSMEFLKKDTETTREKFYKLSQQYTELSDEIKKQKEKINSDRSVFTSKIVLEIMKDKLSPQEYQALELQIKEKLLSKEEREKVKKEYNEEEKLLSETKIESEKFIEAFKKLSKEKKLIVGEFLTKHGFICGGCGSSFGRFKSPSSCGSCVRAGQIFDAWDLWEYLEYHGSREYGLPESTLQKAYEAALLEDGILKEAEEEKLRKKEERLQELSIAIERLEKKIKSYYKVEYYGYNADEIEKIMPEAFESIAQAISEDKKKIEDIKIDLESKTLIILLDYRYYSGSGGSEYGKILRIRRGDSLDSKTFVYRDAYSASKDDRSLAFTNITSLQVEGDIITVTLKSGEGTRTFTFNIPYTKKESHALSDKEKDDFLKIYETTKAELLKRHTREKGIMPSYVPYYNAFLSSISGGIYDIPYKKAVIVDERLDEIHGEGYIVIQAQIDHDAGRGIQYERVKYKITTKGAEMIDRDCAYESELKEGKEIRMKA